MKQRELVDLICRHIGVRTPSDGVYERISRSVLCSILRSHLADEPPVERRRVGACLRNAMSRDPEGTEADIAVEIMVRPPQPSRRRINGARKQF
jgi:hypothetical protein